MTRTNSLQSFAPRTRNDGAGDGELTAVSLFGGIGGFGLALERCGVNAAVEIDPDCRGVTARHFPETPCSTT